MTEEVVTIALDESAREELRRWLDADELIDAAEEQKRKAREALETFLYAHDATVGTLEGKPVCKLIDYDSERIDEKRLKDEEPFLFRRFARLSHVKYIRLVGSR